MTNIINYVLGGLLALSMLFGGYQWWHSSSLTKQLETSKTTIATLSVQKEALQANNDSLKAVIDTQNASVAALGEVKKSVDALFANFNSSVAATNKQIGSIKDAIKKEPIPVDCKSTIQYLKDARKELK